MLVSPWYRTTALTFKIGGRIGLIREINPLAVPVDIRVAPARARIHRRACSNT